MQEEVIENILHLQHCSCFLVLSVFPEKGRSFVQHEALNGSSAFVFVKVLGQFWEPEQNTDKVDISLGATFLNKLLLQIMCFRPLAVLDFN